MACRLEVSTTQRRRVFLTTKPAHCEAKRDGGRWGVAHACEHLEIFTAVASLICAQRYELAMTILENEIDDSNSNIDL